MSTPRALEQRYIGTELGSFRIVEPLGAGGMGAVFLAQHNKVDLRAAIKILRDSHADQAAVARFLQEAKLLSRLSHPSLVKLQDCGSLPDGALFLQMEYLQGQPLPVYLRDRGGKLPVSEVISFGRQVASALAYVHHQGILHRDLKPSNLFVIDDPELPGGRRVKVLDFGIAKLRSAMATLSGQAAISNTGSGQVLGTPRYMSPEQCEGIAELDDRSDVYSLGLILYELLSGESPYPIPHEPLGWLLAHVQKRACSIQSLVPTLHDSPQAALGTLIMQMLDKLAAQRPSMTEVEATLSALLSGLAPPPRRAPARKSPPIWFVGLGAALALGGVIFVPRLLHLRAPWTRDGSLSDRRVALAALQARAPKGTVLVPGGRFPMGSNEGEIDAALADCQQHRKDCQREEYERERPVHVVTVSDFFVDRFEVTNEDFAAFLNRPQRPTVVEDERLVVANGVLLLDLHPKASGIAYREGRFVALPGHERRPVVQVTWNGAREFCAAQGKRLPREAEWELSARSGKRRSPYPWTGFALSAWPWKPEQGEQPRCDGVVMARAPGQRCAGLPADSTEADVRRAREVGTAPQDVSPQGVYDLAGNVRE
ncbi:MAG TPA: bifunctional serine/threonine-protein kinase/formylglycine-generating enzyme family protein, partial [Pseudomonadota bacterium]|nr:bifunctional serine/threonine-protein kinase/formylglycine-generating enzyme family protein [Pseudomonadota bacterium]